MPTKRSRIKLIYHTPTRPHAHGPNKPKETKGDCTKQNRRGGNNTNTIYLRLPTPRIELARSESGCARERVRNGHTALHTLHTRKQASKQMSQLHHLTPHHLHQHRKIHPLPPTTKNPTTSTPRTSLPHTHTPSNRHHRQLHISIRSRH